MRIKIMLTRKKIGEYYWNFDNERNNMEQELKHGDVVLMELNGCKEVEGRFIGYLIGSKEQAVIQYGNPFITQIIATSFFRKKPEPKKRLMTAKELAGRWVRKPFEDGGSFDMLVTCVKKNNPHKVFCYGHELDIVNSLLYTETPADDSSWKSVLVDNE